MARDSLGTCRSYSIPYGYIGCLLFMLAVVIFQIVYFKKRHWL